MWRAAIGGGLLTVVTAALKMRIVDAHLPPFLEGLASGTNYAVSFVLLQVFGLVLATKQPAATAATFAGIVRDNRGAERSNKIADFVSHITSTQLAAALGNVVAVAAGSIVFDRLWRLLFTQPFLTPKSAEHVYEMLNPLHSATAFYAIVTGIILWLAALAGGWCENFATYYRITDAVAEHPVGTHVGQKTNREFCRHTREKSGGMVNEHCARIPAWFCTGHRLLLRGSAGRSPRNAILRHVSLGGSPVRKRSIGQSLALLCDGRNRRGLRFKSFCQLYYCRYRCTASL